MLLPATHRKGHRRRCIGLPAAAIVTALATALATLEASATFVQLKNVSAPFGRVRDIDMEVVPGQVTYLLGPSGCGKSTLLKLLASEQPAEADVFDVGSLHRPLEVLESSSFALNALSGLAISAEAAEVLLNGWGVTRLASPSRTTKWKAICVESLRKQHQHKGQLPVLLLDEALDRMPRPLRLTFAHDLYKAAKAQGFAVLSATHCLSGDVSWLAKACDQILLMDKGRVTDSLRTAEPQHLVKLENYAAMRCRLGTVNA